MRNAIRTASSSHTNSAAAEVDLLLDSSDAKPSSRRTLKQQRRRQRPKSSLQKQQQQQQVNVLTKEQALSLFDNELAPHLPLSTLRHVCSLLRKRMAASDEGTNVRGKMAKLWHKEPNKTKIPPKWAQDAILRALVVGRHQGKKNKRVLNDHEQESSLYPPHVNRENFKVKAHCLVEARESMSLEPLVWSSGIHVKDDTTTTNDVDPYTVEERRERYLAKSEQELQHDAETLLHHLADSLPLEDFKRVMQFMEHMRDGKLKNKKKTLMPQLGRCSRSHLHLIVEPLANYFDVVALSHDKELVRSAQQWTELGERFATNLPHFQTTVLKGNNNKKKKRTKKAQEEEAIAQVGELKLKPTAAPPTKTTEAPKRKRRKHHLRLEAMFLESPSSTKADDDDSADDDVVPDDAALETNNTNRMVFLDNLPIDITEMELYDLYSRVGPITSLEIYNQRPELDPGPLSFAKLRERKVYHRKNRRRSTGKKWLRPKTPVYALVSFATQEGYDTALSAPLRLFGMVVRKHAIRSTIAAECTTLYCENLPPGLHAHDLEYQLALALDESFYVCLDLGAKKSMSLEPTSCEISFPTFTAAYAAQDKVLQSVVELSHTSSSSSNEEEDEEEQLAVNWFRTRPDANQYWTRETGFE